MTAYKTNDLFGVPDELNKPAQGLEKRSPRKPRAKPTATEASTTAKQHKSVKASTPGVAESTARLPGQGFLPGLSRRGRPRLAQPISAVERTAEHRRKRIANGAKRVEIILDRDVSQALDRLAEHHQEPRSDVIATLIRKAAKRF
jgi:hypothetical protein